MAALQSQSVGSKKRVSEAINNMTDTKQERNHRQGDTEQSGISTSSFVLARIGGNKPKHGTKASKQRHKQHRQSPADISQQTTLQCTKDNK